MTLEECWNFFSTPTNLKILTPEHLGFKIINEHNGEPMYAGQIIAYHISPFLNVPIEWVTEITFVDEPHYFIDEQRSGPYKFWHHEHRFKEIPGGVELVDILYYTMPYGILGKALHAVKVDADIDAIFTYRKAKLETLFGSYVKPGG